nr:NBS-containing resistance-like protein [Tanacetum cinerariifolium]
MYDEYNALVKNGTWDLVPMPADVNMVRSVWLFKHKFHVDGTLSRYKARLVANDSSQQLGVDFDETFSPLVKLDTIRTVFSLLVSRYTDADWAGCPSSRRSTFEYCVFLGDNLLSWPSKWQHTISHSSSEAEYRGVANVVTETTWIRNLLRELHSPLVTDTLVYYAPADIFTKGLPSALFEEFGSSLSVHHSPAQTVVLHYL